MRGRDTLIRAILPTTEAGLPCPDLRGFWVRFDHAAPAHLRAGMGVATVALAYSLPLALMRRPLAHLTRPQADAVLARAAELPGTRHLVDVAKIVAGMAVFSDPAVQSAVRGGA